MHEPTLDPHNGTMGVYAEVTITPPTRWTGYFHLWVLAGGQVVRVLVNNVLV